MTGEEWERLVERLDSLARAEPARYRRRVGLLAGLGYAYVVGVLALLIAAAAGVVWLAIIGTVAILKFLIPLGAFVLLILRALWVRVPPPEGIRLTRKDAEPLWRALDELRNAVEGPKVHTLLLDGQLNAGIVQIPRLGPLGWQRNYLVVGLPLMPALDEDEFRAVVAHELGHLSKSHGRFASWIYRLRSTWTRLLMTLEEDEHWGQYVFRRFFGWYAPYFNAYSFALARAHEYEADQAAADATGPRTAARALVSLTTAARVVEGSFWPSVYERARKEAEPPADAFGPLGDALVGGRNERMTARWVSAELEQPSGWADTHPSLADRLRSLGVPEGEELALLRTNGDGRASAASRLLGPAADDLAGLLDREWRQAVLPAWREEHRRAQDAQAALGRLDERAASEELPEEDAWQRAELTAEFRGPDEAIPLLEGLLARSPEDARAHFALGGLLLDREDERGLDHLERAVSADPGAVLPACERAFVFLTEQGRDEEAERYRARAEEHLKTLADADEERQSVSLEDEFLPHGLPDDVVERLRRLLRFYEEVGQAYVVRKRLRHLADQAPLYVVGIVQKRRLRRALKDNGPSSLAERLVHDIRLPSDFHVIVPGRGSGLNEKLAAVDGAAILDPDES
jgi:Zn-dependent protease with chaperone function